MRSWLHAIDAARAKTTRFLIVEVNTDGKVRYTSLGDKKFKKLVTEFKALKKAAKASADSDSADEKAESRGASGQPKPKPKRYRGHLAGIERQGKLVVLKKTKCVLLLASEMFGPRKRKAKASKSGKPAKTARKVKEEEEEGSDAAGEMDCKHTDDARADYSQPDPEYAFTTPQKKRRSPSADPFKLSRSDSSARLFAETRAKSNEAKSARAKTKLRTAMKARGPLRNA